MQVHEGIKLDDGICGECNTTFTTKSSLKRHIESVHKKITYKCSLCELGFSREEALHKHNKRVHENDD
jgi:uncharacterized Zn-finger protein